MTLNINQFKMETLKEKVYEVMVENNPDLIVSLQTENGVTSFIESLVESKRATIETILRSNHQPNEKEEEILNELMSELVPSRFHYVRDLFSSNYKEKYEEFLQLGMVNTIVMNLLEFCGKIFERHGFSNMTEDSPWLQFEILASMEAYFEVD